ncbi:MAG: PEP-CTERM sorting domain-containing protein [Verrucomicrobiota bacterium]
MLPKFLIALASFAFAGKACAALTVLPPQPITHTLTVNPIIVSNTSGQVATFFGTDTQRLEIEGFVDTIMSQAGIDVEWLSPQFLTNNNALYDSNASGIPLQFFSQLTSDTIESTVPSVVNMWFVHTVPGQSHPPSSQVRGHALVDAEGVAMSINANTQSTFGVLGREAIAAVVSHELAHNLGLQHVTITNNLLEANIMGHQLNASQISTIFTDAPGFDGFDLLVEIPAIPEPGSALLLLCVTGVVLARRRR